MTLRHPKYRVKFPISLQSNHLTPFSPAIAKMMAILMIQLVNRPHVIIHIESILQTIKLKLVQCLIEGQPIKDALIDQVLFEVNTAAILNICVLLDDVDEIDYHL